MSSSIETTPEDILDLPEATLRARSSRNITLHYILGPPESTPRDVHSPPEVTLGDILGQKGCSTCEWHNFVLKLGRHTGGGNNKNLKMLPVEWPPKDWRLKRSQEMISTAFSVHSGLIDVWIMTICTQHLTSFGSTMKLQFHNA